MAVMNDVTEVLHKIEAKLYPNYLVKGGGAYVARSKAEAPLSIEDICASAKNRGGFTGQYEDLVEHTHVFINEMIYQLLDGFSVQVGGYFSLHTRIGGTYNGERDTIGSDKIAVSFRELAALKELLAKIKVENEGLAGDGAFIDEVADAHSEALNSTVTPGGMVHITGHKIKVEGQKAKPFGLGVCGYAANSRELLHGVLPWQNSQAVRHSRTASLWGLVCEPGGRDSDEGCRKPCGGRHGCRLFSRRHFRRAKVYKQN